MSDLIEGLEPNVHLQRSVNIFILLLANLYLIFMIPVFFFLYPNLLLGTVYLIVLIIVLPTTIYFFKTNNSAIVTRVIGIVGTVTLMFNVATGAIANTGILFAFPFPIACFYLMKRKESVFWIGISIIGLSSLIPISFLKVYSLPYSLPYYGGFIFSYTLSFLMLQFYTKQKEKADSLVLQRNQEIIAVNKQLEESLHTQGKLNDELAKKTDDLSKINQLMLGRELKMIELKEELEAAKQKVN